MKKSTGVLIGCGVVLFLALALAGFVALFIYNSSQDPTGVAVTVEVPDEVVVGDTFELVVKVRNERTGEAFNLADIDIGESYLKAFTVVSVDPEAKSSEHVPIDDSQSYSFDTEIAPGGEATFKFKLRAETEGVARGDVDICEGWRFLTKSAQTAVKAKK